MIVNPDLLEEARKEWQLDDDMFGDAAAALESAKREWDVRNTLTIPPYWFWPHPRKWGASNRDALKIFMFGYALTETLLAAWVEIHFDGKRVP